MTAAAGRRAALGLALLVSGAAAVGLKAFYSQASPAALRWILGPTAAVVEGLTRAPFRFEDGVGYVCQARRFAIAAPCAGVNYLIAVFLTGVVAFAPSRRSAAGTLAVPVGAAAVAYLATVLVNGVRVALAVSLGGRPAPWGLSADAAHRLQGVVIYLGALLVLFAAARRLLSPAAEGGGDAR